MATLNNHNQAQARLRAFFYSPFAVRPLLTTSTRLYFVRSSRRKYTSVANEGSQELGASPRKTFLRSNPPRSFSRDCSAGFATFAFVLSPEDFLDTAPVGGPFRHHDRQLVPIACSAAAFTIGPLRRSHLRLILINPRYPGSPLRSVRIKSVVMSNGAPRLTRERTGGGSPVLTGHTPGHGLQRSCYLPIVVSW